MIVCFEIVLIFVICTYVLSGHRSHHRDYKRIEAASGNEPRNKLNKSNGGANLSPGCTPMKINIFGFLLVFYDHDTKIY